MIVYKVVLKTEDGRYVSSTIDKASPFQLEYKVGQPTYPPEICPMALPMAFRTLSAAIIFAALDGETDDALRTYRKVFLADASEVIHVTKASAHLDGSHLLDYWKSGVGPTIELGFSSVWCKDITLLGEIE